MTTQDPGAAPVTRGQAPPATFRQLTIGECIAVAELANRFSPPAMADVPLRAVMAVVDAMRVCTVCGQVESHHGPDKSWSGACTRYAPRD